MNKIILWVVGIGVVLGGGYILFSQKEVNNTVVIESPKTMRELLAVTEPSQCTFTHETEVSKSSGIVYVAQGKLRGNFDVLAKPTSQNFNAYMIHKDQKVYVWSGMMSQGVELDSKTFEESVPSQGTENSLGFDQEVNYECEPWNLDVSVFELPQDITFSIKPTFDIQVDSSASSEPFISCEICNSLPEGVVLDQCRLLDCR